MGIPGHGPWGLKSYGKKASPTMYQRSKYECFLVSCSQCDGNAEDLGDYNSSLHFVHLVNQLIKKCWPNYDTKIL